MHGMLETDTGLTLMGADTPPGMAHNPGDNITVSLSGDDAGELRGYWEKLSEAGTVTVPLEKQMWGVSSVSASTSSGSAGWSTSASRSPRLALIDWVRLGSRDALRRTARLKYGHAFLYRGAVLRFDQAVLLQLIDVGPADGC